jgi:adenosylhomocysteine nucleosidase
MNRIAIIAAMPAELKPLVRGWQQDRQNGVELWRWSFDEGEWIAACAGAGVNAATRAFGETERDGPLSCVISTGWAGALRADLKAGQAYDVSAVIDIRTGEQFRPGKWFGERWLVTSPRVADAPEKLRLAETYSAALVDMEASAVARLAQMRGIPFYCIKGISDSYTEQLPDFNRFITPDGQFKLASFIVFAVFHPWHWPALIRMGENSKKAAQCIAASLLDFLDERGYIRSRNDYPNYKR